MAVQSEIFSTEYGVRSFISTKHIATKQHMSVWLQRSSDNIWVQLSTSNYELINNSAVLTQAPNSTTYSQVEIRVADTPDELGASQSEISIVAGLYDEIVALNGIKNDITTVAGNTTNIATVSNNTENINSVVTNLTEILQADTNATIATTQAGIATTKAEEASYYATITNYAIVETLAELEVLDTTQHNNICIVKDFDRGGTFIWSATGTANGGTVFEGASGYWIRQYSGAINVKWFGAKGDGVTDDTTFIKNTITAAIPTKTDVYIPKGTYGISSTISISDSGVTLIGEGSQFRHNGGGQGDITTIKAISTISGAVLKVSSPDDVLEQKRTSIEVTGIRIDCNNLADTGLEIRSVNNSSFTNINIYRPLVQGCYIGCVNNLAEERDPQQNWINQMHIQCYDGASDNADGIIFDGVVGANTSINTFGFISVVYKNGVGVKFVNADNNQILNLRCGRIPNGTGNAVEFHGDNGDGQFARSNVIQKYSGPANAPLVAYGTETYTNPSINNSVFMIDTDNGSPWVTVGTGANVNQSKTNGIINNIKSYGKIQAAPDVAGLLQLKGLGYNHPMQIFSASDNNLLLACSTGIWAIENTISDGGLRIRRVSGTGSLSLPETSFIKIGGQQVSKGANNSGGTGFRALVVPNS